MCPIALIDRGTPDVLVNLESVVLTSARVHVAENGRIAEQLEMLFHQFQRVLERAPFVLVEPQQLRLSDDFPIPLGEESVIAHIFRPAVRSPADTAISPFRSLGFLIPRLRLERQHQHVPEALRKLRERTKGRIQRFVSPGPPFGLLQPLISLVSLIFGSTVLVRRTNWHRATNARKRHSHDLSVRDRTANRGHARMIFTYHNWVRIYSA